MKKETVTRLCSEIEARMNENKIAGISIALTDREGVILSRGFGFADTFAALPALDTSYYRAASITKMVTGVLTMRLVEEGRLSLSDRVIDRVPELVLSNRDAAEVMTLEHLLSHTSGLPAEYTPDGPHDEGLLADSLFSALPTVELGSMPGDGRFCYSNWGIRLLSLVIERVMGERYSALAKRYVLDPLGMTESFFFLPDALLGMRSLPHSPSDDGCLVSETTILENHVRLATGGLYSTVLDLSRLARFFMRRGVTDSGEIILTEDSVLKMREPISTLSSGDRYGLVTQMHTTPGGAQLVGHYGNASPYTSAMFVTDEGDLGAVVMTNTNHATLRREICDLIIDTARTEQ
jgi:CubicO group peptidase (beta-lactamase class C family)